MNNAQQQAAKFFYANLMSKKIAGNITIKQDFHTSNRVSRIVDGMCTSAKKFWRMRNAPNIFMQIGMQCRKQFMRNCRKQFDANEHCRKQFNANAQLPQTF